jgi:sulfur relay (sulfurtransferase) complex TusBCD TusD component (DsrE family)
MNEIVIDADLLESLIENTETLIGLFLYMEGTTRGDRLLAALRNELQQAREAMESTLLG